MLVIHSVTFIPVVLTQHIHQIFKLYPLRGYYCEGKKMFTSICGQIKTRKSATKHFEMEQTTTLKALTVSLFVGLHAEAKFTPCHTRTKHRN